MKDNLFKQDGRERMMRGITRCAEVIGGTMGSAGHNAIIECIERPGTFTTNDGITILESINFADPLEDMGRKILLEAVSRANKQSGDGSSTTTVLCAAIIEEAMKYINSYCPTCKATPEKVPSNDMRGWFNRCPKCGDELKSQISPMGLKKSLEEYVPIIEESINKQKKAITVDEVSQVATISSEDEKIGSLIQEIYQQIGKSGIIHWDVSKTFEDHYTIGKGITIDGAGFASPYMADLDEKTGAFSSTARWNNPKILITKQKITSATDFNDLFQALFTKEIKEVVVFCDEYEGNLIPDLIRTRALRGFKTLLVKMPTLWKDWWYEDLAKATGATVIDPNAGTSFKLMTLEHLGTCEHITVDKDNTYLDGIKDVSEHIKSLEVEATEDTLLRASRLNTKTARYFVGAPSDSALSYKRLKVEDAIAAAYQALNHGVVAGGGSALITALDELPDTIGGNILKEALKAPARQIAANAGHPDMDIDDGYRFGRGFNTKTGEFVESMFEAGIVNPAQIEINAVRNAISVAASVLTCSVTVLLPRQDAVEQLIQAVMSRNMPQ